MGPLGSRDAMLTMYLSKGHIYAATGCFTGTAKQFTEAIKKTHGNNEHGVNYAAAIKFGVKYLGTKGASS